MKKVYDILLENLELCEEKNEDSFVREFEKNIDVVFPNEYRKIISMSNGSNGDIGNEYIEFWSLEDIEDFEIVIGKESLNGLVPFASDGCGMAYAFKRGSNEIRMIPMDSLDLKSSRKCAENFDDFIMKLYDGKIIEYGV